MLQALQWPQETMRISLLVLVSLLKSCSLTARRVPVTAGLGASLRAREGTRVAEVNAGVNSAWGLSVTKLETNGH